jgi:hypothetical protein
MGNTGYPPQKGPPAAQLLANVVPEEIAADLQETPVISVWVEGAAEENVSEEAERRSGLAKELPHSQHKLRNKGQLHKHGVSINRTDHRLCVVFFDYVFIFLI